MPYTAAHIAAVQAFNARLREGGAGGAFGIQSFLRESDTAVLQRQPGTGLYEELFLAVDGEAVRGGYSLKHQDFVIDGQVVAMAFFQQPISESTIDKRFALVGPRLLRDALAREPLLYALGIGGEGEAAARLLKGSRFELASVPFLFRVEHARAFLRNVGPLRATRLRRLVADAAAVTGGGAAGIWALQHRRAIRPPGRGGTIARDAPDLAAVAEAVWPAARAGRTFIGVRDGAIVDRLYGGDRLPFLRIAVEESGGARGWAVCLASQRQGDRYFGSMRLGSIVDLLAVPGHEPAVVGAAIDRLRQERVDLIISNQSHGPVVEALRRHGFLDGPSNFLFAASPALAARIGPVAANLGQYHLNRGDGDGPINL